MANKKNKNTELQEESFDSLKSPKVDDLNNEENNKSQAEENSDNKSSESETSIDMLEKAHAEAKENYQKYLYAMAEMDNMKKRHIKERSDLIKYNGENIARDVLEVLDDLERTAEQSKDTPSEVLLEGITLIASRMRSLLERHQVKAEDSLGEKFNPNKHEALTMSPSEEAEPGTIIHQMKKAYNFKDKLLRPAQVVVATKPENSDSSSEDKSEE